ncbi:carbamoyl-phosphate synthase small subunit [Parvularcula bermudensis HTCC2503]|uniref:Carbamoyl phosphate synthase small chain n=1 Tax=Parvularcula bermudensis (strain ATCC BAA-594 / HTCC2503 / KCTC 12087) TaxID=314260 RepID=E0TGP6_PARBH|nr:glutamine-hydrolyzing carbamoyl-phosphate synthase small subunit [Parvularcula bermudensis]ADM10655.1 carbamoyl-phosphate synthase small subunit [Parvularcula bermudensis HTCC2503]
MRISQDRTERPTTGRLVLSDGTVFEGEGFGQTGAAVGEVCFNTAMTGYQEILTDPSYAQQIVTFTFPHIGNVGANDEDIENASTAASVAARGAVVRAEVTAPSNYRARADLNAWMRRRGIIGLSGIDTRALTSRIRETGMPHGTIAYSPSGQFDIEALRAAAAAFPGLEGAELTKSVTQSSPYAESEGAWSDQGFAAGREDGPHAVVVDFGAKRTILRCLVAAGARVTVVGPSSSAEEILALSPDGVVLSNGPGDPAATAQFAVPMIKGVLAARLPLLGICLGHQLLALAIGAKTMKMPQGHHGANHPVKDHRSGRVEIVSMNHGFAVDAASLPAEAEATHTSLFDGSNAGFSLRNAPVISVQHHPEAGPGPQDSAPIFARFVSMMATSAQ